MAKVGTSNQDRTIRLKAAVRSYINKCCVNYVKKTQNIAVLKLVVDMRTVATGLQRIYLHSKIYTRKTVPLLA